MFSGFAFWMRFGIFWLHGTAMSCKDWTLDCTWAHRASVDFRTRRRCGLEDCQQDPPALRPTRNSRSTCPRQTQPQCNIDQHSTQLSASMLVFELDGHNVVPVYDKHFPLRETGGRIEHDLNLKDIFKYCSGPIMINHINRAATLACADSEIATARNVKG